MNDTSSETPGITIFLSLFLLSAALLTFEINLTRIYSVSQFYHFAFMIVSIALLGFGASGSALSIFPILITKETHKSISALSLLVSISILVSFLFTNFVPFNSFSIAWDRSQLAILIIHYIILAAPFFFGGLAVGLLLAKLPNSAGRVYTFNLTGSAVGCITALTVPILFGGEGTVILSCLMGVCASSLSILKLPSKEPKSSYKRYLLIAGGLTTLLFIFSTVDLGFRYFGIVPYTWFDLRISPYKSLSYALQYPGSVVKSSLWNSYSRVDLVSSEGIRSLPGLSYRYLDKPPEQDGLFVDSDDLNPVVLSVSDSVVYSYLPTSIAYYLRPDSEALILGSRGGLDVLTAMNSDAISITAVEVNRTILDAANHIYENPIVKTISESDRSFLNRSKDTFDVVVLSLTSTYHPVRSGAYSLSEDYRYTVESFQNSLNQLNRDGIFAVTRWLQNPPSEFLRTFAIAVTALENLGIDPAQNILALRGYNTGTLLVKVTGFSDIELKKIREFSSGRNFDLVYAPDIDRSEVNQYNILTEPLYFETFQELLYTFPREEFYRTYTFDVSPPTDDKPFLGHYFKWSQANQIMAEFGKTWQPFGGAGYFVIIALLLLAVTVALFLIILPIIVFQIRKYINPLDNNFNSINKFSLGPSNHRKRYILYFIYFGLLGLGFLFVEIPLIQGFILYLGHPSFALSTILFTILLFSGIGSRISQHVSLLPAISILVIILLFQPIILPYVFETTLGFPIITRITVTIMLLAPVGFLMGIPFPSGIKNVSEIDQNPVLTPWFWAINGSISVISSILAALLALSFGFTWVFRFGALFYAAAWLAAKFAFNLPPVRSPHR